MVDQAGNLIPAPGINRGPYVADDELLYSAVGYTQKGVRLAAGQGLLPLGTALARKTSTRKYVKWVNGAGDGVGTPVGILRKTTETGTDEDGQEYMANIVIMGILKLAKISAANGGFTNITTALNATSSELLGTFKF